MRGVGRVFLVLTVVLVLAAVVTACAGTQKQGTTTKQQSSSQNQDISKITQSWVNSAHQQPVTFAAEEQFCAGCHDGGAFATGTADPKKLGRDEPFGAWVVATDCRACHTGRGQELMRSGTATITTASETISAGTGAVCLACHHELGKPNPNDATHSGPHPSSQAGIWSGTGGMTQGLTLKSTKPHATIKKACVSCHMTSTSWGPNHELVPVAVSQTCALSGCHDGKTDGAPNLQVKADYDGNGKAQGIQTEVAGLQSILTSATLAESKATTITEDKGVIKLKKGTSDVTFDQKVYVAAYNLLLTEQDKSQGVHNPWYTVTLLQETYKQLTGKAVPNAKTPE